MKQNMIKKDDDDDNDVEEQSTHKVNDWVIERKLPIDR